MRRLKIVEIHHLTTGYQLARGIKRVSSELELVAYSGELTALMGPNGSGKSTLIQTLAGLIAPLSGEVWLAGEAQERLTAQERARLMSIVLSERIEHTGLSVEDIVATGRYPYTGLRGKLTTSDRAIIAHSLALCRAEHLRSRQFVELSDGERQRIMIARALAQDTPLMLLDEPTAHLDLPSRIEVLMMLRGLARSLNKCILVSTHELDLAMQWSDAIWLFDREQGVEVAAPEDLVLSQSIERTFGRAGLHFDQETATFRTDIPVRLPLRLSAQGLQRQWAERALHRMGYAISQRSDDDCPCLTALPTGWRLQIQATEYTVPNLYLLQHILYQHYPIGDG